MTHTSSMDQLSEVDMFLEEIQRSGQVEEMLKNTHSIPLSEEDHEENYKSEMRFPMDENHLYAWEPEDILEDDKIGNVRRQNLIEELSRHMDQMSELAEKKQFLEQIRIDCQYRQALEAQVETEKIEKFQLETHSEMQVQDYCQKLDSLRSISIEKGMPLSDVFGSIPFFFPKSMTGIAGGTGDGKSTAAASILVNMAEANKRVLFVSNEESVETQMLRTACAATGIPFGGVSSFSQWEYVLLKEKIRELCNNVRFLDDSSAGPSGLFSTIEGWEKFFDKFEKDVAIKKYDLLLIDYYQGVFSSKRRPSMKDSEVQSMFVQRLERFREEVGIPIIILLQLWDKKGTFQERIKGSRSIIQRLTAAFELVSDHKTMSANLVIRKLRYQGDLKDASLKLVLERGRFRVGGVH